MTRIEAEELLQDVMVEIEEDLELMPGLLGRVLIREHETPGDPVANFFIRLITAKLDRKAVVLFDAAENDSRKWC